MLETNNLITPTYNGINRYDKPILFYWFIIISYRLFGINEFSARLPSAVSAILISISIFLFVKKHKDTNYAILSVVTWVLSLYYLVYSRAAVTDMVLCLFICISLFSFYNSTNQKYNAKKKNYYLYSFYFFSALAVLTKGLIGIVIPFGIAIIYQLFTEGKKGIPKIFNIVGLIIFMVVCLPWFVIQYSINGSDFINNFFIKHHLKRYTGVISGHKGPLYYFIPILIIGTFPWIAYLPISVKRAIKEKEGLSKFLLIWFLFIFTFFSFSTTKLPNYILPAIPALCILLSYGIYLQDDKWQNLSNSLLVILSIVFSIILLILRNHELSHEIVNAKWLYSSIIIFILIAISSIYQIFLKKRIFWIVCICSTLFLYTTLLELFPSINKYLQGSLYKYSLYAKEKLNKNEKLMVMGLNNPSIVFYSGRKIIPIRNKEEFKKFSSENKYNIIITKIKYVDYLSSSGFEIIEKDKNYAILEKK
jgi:4-amino-4-deoxy-L-arabinose transferase-like glycosyltransferase